ncbi:hypothetical protein M419DRAFT_129920 [Trichoderma reesei RUT C-30]|uniref:Uncharacterized protein n=1 Tax=Hypocrea jecorina (strain ATCC 56765 / BCRC 32924 / NRRL 11460 / Rut C-30) TaxID=1344414 RepID=A0A024SD53_HYPJR|nr:hypothetical protein M419DRAFT_129920 [Trichoderma reesei RUT C-30]
MAAARVERSEKKRKKCVQLVVKIGTRIAQALRVRGSAVPALTRRRPRLVASFSQGEVIYAAVVGDGSPCLDGSIDNDGVDWCKRTNSSCRILFVEPRRRGATLAK